jgi:hypothetical protein
MKSIYVIKLCDLFSRAVFDEKVAMINRRNLEADLGLHTYTFKANQFADIVQMWTF